MPLYEYKCDRCSKVFEVMQKFSDAPLTVHEGCGGGVERLISPPAFQFKGSGWYVNDYAGKSKSGNGTSKSSSDSSSKSETKSESKPAETKSSDSKPATTP